MKRILMGCFCILCFSLMQAQSQNIHIVSRGESPQSIASYYGITVEELQEANPSFDFSEYFYSGMKLNIPDNNKRISEQGNKRKKKDKSPVSSKVNNRKTKADKKDKPVSNSELAASVKPVVMDTEVDKTSLVKSKRLNGSQFSSVSLVVGAESSALTGGYYGLRGQYFMQSGFGATLLCTSTYGFNSYGALIFKLGPSYVYSIKKWLYVEGTLAYTVTMAHARYKSGVVSGISLMPEVGFSFRKLRIGIGFEGFWRNGGGVAGGFYLGVGYAFK